MAAQAGLCLAWSNPEDTIFSWRGSFVLIEQVSSEAADTTTSSTANDDIETTDNGDVEMVEGSDHHDKGGNKTTSTVADDDENNADVSDMEADEPEPVKSRTTRYKGFFP